MGQMTDERLAQLRNNPLPYTDDDGQEIVVRGADDWRDLLAHIDALTAEVARLRGKLDALATAVEERFAHIEDHCAASVAEELDHALRAARGAGPPASRPRTTTPRRTGSCAS